MKLLIEDAEQTLVEATKLTEGDDKKYYIQGIFAQAELKNRNGRLYPKSVMENAVTNYQKLIEARRSISELNHPEQPSVNPERASHIIESLKWDGNNVMGKARIMTQMPMGKVAKALIDEGVQLGVSTRGLGSLSERTGARVVQSDFILTAIDIVGDPSAPDAFVEGLMEGADWVWNATAKAWVVAEQSKRIVESSTRKAVDERKARLFERFLKSL